MPYEETEAMKQFSPMRPLGQEPASGRDNSSQKYCAENYPDPISFHSAKSLSRPSTGRLVPDPVGPMLASAVGNNSHISGQYSSLMCWLFFFPFFYYNLSIRI
jgi:hypothetical protein